jgi:hypothetical protein
VKDYLLQKYRVNVCEHMHTMPNYLKALSNINTLHYFVDKPSTQAHCTGSYADLESTLSITAVSCPLLRKHSTPRLWLLRWFTLETKNFS